MTFKQIDVRNNLVILNEVYQYCLIVKCDYHYRVTIKSIATGRTDGQTAFGSRPLNPKALKDWRWWKVKLLACGPTGPGSNPGLVISISVWVFPAFKSRYNWEIAKATLNHQNQNPTQALYLDLSASKQTHSRRSFCAQIREVTGDYFLYITVWMLPRCRIYRTLLAL